MQTKDVIPIYEKVTDEVYLIFSFKYELRHDR